MKKKTQMKKTNVDNFKEVTHEIEFMFFFHILFRQQQFYMWKINTL